MISFELARKKAKEVIPKVDVYYEYPDAYWFRIAKPSKDEIWDNAVIIDKHEGKVLTAFQYVTSSKYADKKPEMKKL